MSAWKSSLDNKLKLDAQLLLANLSKRPPVSFQCLYGEVLSWGGLKATIPML